MSKCRRYGGRCSIRCDDFGNTTGRTSPDPVLKSVFSLTATVTPTRSFERAATLCHAACFADLAPFASATVTPAQALSCRPLNLRYGTAPQRALFPSQSSLAAPAAQRHAPRIRAPIIATALHAQGLDCLALSLHRPVPLPPVMCNPRANLAGCHVGLLMPLVASLYPRSPPSPDSP